MLIFHHGQILSNLFFIYTQNFSSYTCGRYRSADELELIHSEQCKTVQNDTLGITPVKKNIGFSSKYLKCGTKRKSEFPLFQNIKKSKNQRAVQKLLNQQQLDAGNSSTLLVDNCSENRAEKSEMKQRWSKCKTEVAFSQGRSSEPNGLENKILSICSSIGSNNLDVLTGCHLDLNDYTDDAHSFDALKSSWKHTTKQEMDVHAEVHKLELNAYRLTMNLLFASGPISWEQQALMTNLRLFLHISTDEHLSELKHLVSGESKKLS